MQAVSLLVHDIYCRQSGKSTYEGGFEAFADLLPDAKCQSLGYHRIQTMKNDTEDERMGKIFLFWHVYTMDKALSLRLGRPSFIQDWDMSLPYPVHESGLFSLGT
jgi:hypothetical protein